MGSVITKLTDVELEGTHNYADFGQAFERAIRNKSIRDMYFTESSIMTASSWKDYRYRLAKAESVISWLEQNLATSTVTSPRTLPCICSSLW